VYRARYTRVLCNATKVIYCWRLLGSCGLGRADLGRGLVFIGCRVSLLTQFFRLGGELLVGYVPGIRLRVRPFSNSLSNI